MVIIVVVFGQKLLFSGKVVVFVVFGHRYSGCFIPAKWLYSGKCGCNRAKVLLK